MRTCTGLILLALLASCTGEGSSSAADAGVGADGGVGDMAAEPGDMGSTPDTTPSPDSAATPDQGRDEDASPSADAATGDGGSDSGTDDMDLGPPPACDYQPVNDIIVIEAEDLPIIEDWTVATAASGYTGTGYIDWVGASHNNDPSHGVMSVDLRIDTPGRYQMQWHVQIGEGTNTTEHNDAFVRFADADDFYGLKGQPGAEIRRYPKPQCDDPVFTDAIEALADVDVADCVRSSSVDGWMKVYSSGAATWRWSTKTSDNDASDIMIEFDAPGVYTLELAARADRFLIDRIVVHLESVDDNTARDLGLAPTPCN